MLIARSVHPQPGEAERKERLLGLIDGFSNRRILVIGDIIADEFIYGEVARVSREAPVLILKYDATEMVAGGAGNAANNVMTGNNAANTLNGGAGNDTFIGGAGADRIITGAGSDTVVLSSKVGIDRLTDYATASDTIRISQSTLRIGDGDTTVDGGVSKAGSGGFSAAAEVVMITTNIAGALTTASAAATTLTRAKRRISRWRGGRMAASRVMAQKIV